MNCNFITDFKRVGRKTDCPRNIIATIESYETKLLFLKVNKNCEDIAATKFGRDLEEVQCKFLKFVLNINKFASNHSVRAELGRFQLKIMCDTKLIKYWHHIENLQTCSLLHVL